jgi:hypothetical protein
LDPAHGYPDRSDWWFKGGFSAFSASFDILSLALG